MPEMLKLSIKNISISLSAIVLFASIFLYVGKLQGKISAQEIQISELQKNKLDVAVYEANHRNLYDIINLNNLKNDSEHSNIMKTLEKIDSKIDKITIGK